MALVQNDDVVEQLPPDGGDEAFGNAVLPGALVTGPGWLDAHRPESGDDLGGEDRVAVEDEVPGRRLERECLAELVDDPSGGRV